MINDQKQRRVVLIFGKSRSGKSTLAKKLKADYGYYLIKLDRVYEDFVKDQYPELFREDLSNVIDSHYQGVLWLANTPATSGFVEAWQDHVVSKTEYYSGENEFVVVEGYLLLHILDAVQERLAGKAIVTTVEARNWQYFFTKSIEQIHRI